MKKITLLLSALLFVTFGAWADGVEDFTNSAATSSYAGASFVGNDGISWTYVASRDGNGDANSSGIALPALMLRQSSSDSKITSGTISGGIASFSVKLYKGFTGGGNRQVELFINGVSKGTSTAFDDNDEHVFSVPTINIAGDFTIEIRNITSKQVIIDDISWTSYSAGGPDKPTITDFQPADQTEFTKGGNVTISTTVTTLDAGGIDSVCFAYGPVEAMLGDSVKMPHIGDVYSLSLIADTEGSYFGQIIAYGDNGEISYSSKNEIIVIAPKTTTLPYTEDFAIDLGDCYTFSVSGATKEWVHNSAEAYMSGYDSGDVEEDWLVLPGIDLDAYTNEVLSFNTQYNYGSDDANNYLKLMYSSDYDGLGDPSLATWSELSYTAPSSSNTSTPSGSIDISGIVGNSVYFALKYRYESGSYRNWTIEDIAIDGIEAGSVAPVIVSIQPEDEAVATVGDTVNLVVTASVPSGMIDSVLFVYGNPAVDSMKMIFVPAFGYYWLPVPVSMVGDSYYKIKAYGNNEVTVSDMRVIHAQCDAVTVPVATAASNITSTAFDANWEVVADAVDYKLSVWTATSEPAPELVVNGSFEDGSNDWTKFETNYEIVDGAVTSPYLGNYSVKCFASGTRDLAQDITFTADGTSSYDLKFWYKYSSTSDPKKLRLWSDFTTGSYTGDDISTDAYLDAVDEWTEVVYTITPSAGENTLHLEFRTYSGGNAFIDNVSFAKSGTVVTNTFILENVSVGNVLSQDISGLTDATDYNYAVKAVNAFGCESTLSDSIMVTTGTSTVLVPEVTAGVKVFTTTGAIIVKATGLQTVVVYDIAGRQVASTQVEGEAHMAIKQGIYLVRIADTVTKVVVR